MKIDVKTLPRVFRVGPPQDPIDLKDCAHIALDPDEQVTFVTGSGTEFDFCRKSWGYYATPSVNGRVPRFGLRPALVRGLDGKAYVLVTETKRQAEFETYLKRYGHRILCWLDDDKNLERIEKLFSASP